MAMPYPTPHLDHLHGLVTIKKGKPYQGCKRTPQCQARGLVTKYCQEDAKCRGIVGGRIQKFHKDNLAKLQALSPPLPLGEAQELMRKVVQELWAEVAFHNSTALVVLPTSPVTLSSHQYTLGLVRYVSACERGREMAHNEERGFWESQVA